MKPYYDEDGITIYHGDCREILPDLPKCDLLLTDPPYGIGSWSANSSGGFMTAQEAAYVREWDREAPATEELSMILSHAKSAVVWGGNYMALPPTGKALIWDKAQNGMHFAEAEIAWVSADFGTTRILRLPLKSQEIFGHYGSREHPTQKPIKLLTWCISFFPDAQTILDPFMGSGTTLVAAKRMGRKAIGIEIEERYCEIAVNRLAQKVLDFSEALNG